ncbi:MAG: tetratricopeptide repeat protein [Candidatus Thiodiazotropha sp. (ex Myrtea sp. 'scaly one' KF741663)]|nr:tetratricopeptide repeat protein [Candidatus Thiodiazotropha sp. (ex Myrtea sp. 'scaly one' KF741663)]
MKITPLYTLAVLGIFLHGCASPTINHVPDKDLSSKTVPDQQQAPKKQVNGATPALIYNTLAGEIAAQRGDSSLAFDYAYKAAIETRNAKSAERATGLGLQANQPQQALKAAKLWIEIAPNSLKAHQISAILNTRLQDLPATIRHLQRVVEIANAQGQSGYLQAAAITEKAASAPQSLAIMQQLIPAESEDPDALYALALTASRAKQMQLAGEYVDRSLRFKPKATNALILKAHALIASNKKEAGLNFLAQTVEESPDNLTLRNAYARTLVDLNEAEPALAQYQILHRQQPENPDTLYALGILSIQLERLDEAKSHLKKLVEKRQRGNEASYYLGVISEEQKQWETALDWYSRVEGDKQPDAQVRIAKILADSGSLDEARETLQRLRVNQSHHHLKFYMIEAELLRDNLQFEAAHEVYTKAMELFEDNTELLYARGLNAADMNRVDLLEQDLRKILATQPDHADALNALGYTLADKTDRLEEAKAYIERALSMKPDNPAILDSLGWVEFRMGNLQMARDYLQKAATLSPDAEIASHLGEVLWQLGEREQAKAIWKSANDREPKNRFIKPVMQRLGVDN